MFAKKLKNKISDKPADDANPVRKNNFLKPNAKTAKKKTKRKSFWVRHLMEFFRTTGLHGYKYIAMDDIPLIERVCWSIAVIVCLISALTLVMIAWQWNIQNPTITVIESTHFAIWKIPFPAVTICGLNRVSRAKALNVSKALIIPNTVNITSDEIFDFMKYTTAVLGNIMISNDTKDDLDRLQIVIDHNNLTMKQFMDKLSPTCDDLLERCSWKGATTRCENIFQRTLSVDGYCCSFNNYGYKKTTIPAKIALFRPKYPRRIATCGALTALSVLVKINPSDYYSSLYGTYGVKIFVHDSYDFPDDNASAKLVSPGKEAFFEIAPEMTYSTSSVNELDISKRKCVFSSEKHNIMFHYYTYNNCLAECRTELANDICGCVPFFLPSNGSHRVCNFTEISCVHEARKYYGRSLPSGNITCECWADCQYFSYPVEVAVGTLTRIGSRNQLSFFKDVVLTNQSLVHVYFSDLVGTRYRTDVFLSWHNLLASFGGLLGLFIGFSLVSGFEFIYFFTLRFFFDMLHKNEPIDESPAELKKRMVFEKGLSDGQLFNNWAKKHNVLTVGPVAPKVQKHKKNSKSEHNEFDQRF